MSINGDELQITKRRLPHWYIKGATYFVTFRAKDTSFSPAEQQCLVSHIIDGNNKFYTLIAAVVMPDHMHMILIPFESISLSQIMKGIKGASARKINLMRNTTGTIWQDESFDRIIRDQKEFIEKLQYMANNPVKAGLAIDTWSYPGWYFNEEWQTGMSAPPVD